MNKGNYDEFILPHMRLSKIKHHLCEQMLSRITKDGCTFRETYVSNFLKSSFPNSTIETLEQRY